MLYNIQILRFFAALAVVQYHVIDVLLSYGFEQQIMSTFKGWGASGVDLFFVISGFVIYKIVLTRSISPFEFFRDRVIRIVPLYWFFTCLLALVLFMFPDATRTESFDASRFAASLLFVSGLSGYSFPTLGVGWTLEYEFFFYVVITFGLAISIKGKLLLFATVLFTILFFSGWGSSMYFEFLLGMLASALSFTQWSNLHLRSLFVLSIFLVAASIPLTGEGLDRALIYGVPSFLLVFSLATLQQARKGILTFLGDASFSIYLTHQPVLSILGKILERFLPNLNGDITALTVVLILVLIGALTYFILEKPLIQFLKSRVRKPHLA